MQLIADGRVNKMEKKGEGRGGVECRNRSIRSFEAV
jgi:hypothetical protein